MASILYIFPHPDDESFGPAPVMARQRREGHEVHLLTLTKGEATRQRERLGLSKEEMAQTRYREMQDVAEVLDLSSLNVLDFADGELAAMDPRVLEGAVSAHIRETKPAVVVTYAVHGISGHRDHLTGHAVVKRVFCQLRADGAHSPRRLAFFTLPEEDSTDRPEHLTGSPEALIKASVSFSDEDRERGKEALACYKTYRAVIEEHQPLEHLGGRVCFELFQEEVASPLAGLFDRLP